ncbi:MAG TPA: DPP IV N-terminal domain-containing protein, partial [Pirellulaceae bacterium]|nr:DPP IV N-terminal domain-containing protein [Pirellulaceae bacterium]
MIMRALSAWVLMSLWSVSQLAAQSIDLTFEQLPGYERYRQINEARSRLGGGGRVNQSRWRADGSALDYSVGNQRQTLDLTTFAISDFEGAESEQAETDNLQGTARPPRRRPVARAQQRTIEPSPDGKWNAVYRENNVFIESADGQGEPVVVTTAGTELVRYGTCCWVYGEELNQNEAMWWSPDGAKLVFYEVDERGMKDYYLTLNNHDLYTQLLSVRYPKAGDLNPQVALLVYDLATQSTRRFEIPGEERQYLYNIRFAPQGDEILVNRTNRHQNELDVLAINIDNGAVRVVVTEHQEAWQNNSPSMTFLSDGERFVWESERTGFRHFELRHLDGRLLHPLSAPADYPCGRVEKIDEANDWFYYTAFSDLNPYNAQLHRVRLSSGEQHQRLTSSPLNHTSFDISPDHRFVLAVREQVDIPPTTAVYDNHGIEVAVLAAGTTEA